MSLPIGSGNAQEEAIRHLVKVRKDLHFAIKEHAYLATADVRWLCVLLEQFVMEVRKLEARVRDLECEVLDKGGNP